MKKIIQTFTLGLAGSLLTASLLLFVPSPVHALISNTDAKNEVCQGISLSDSAASCSASPQSANHLLVTVINIFSLIAGIIAVIMIIIGGIKYITSQGESARVASAKDTIIYSVVGLVVVSLAQVIVRFVLYKTK